MRILVLVLLVIFNSSLLRFLDSYDGYDRLDAYTWESDEFRAMRLGPVVAAQEEIDCEELAARMTEHDFDLTGLRRNTPFLLQLPVKKPLEFQKLSDAYRMIFEDLVWFPVPRSRNLSVPDVTYGDGWLEKRTYGGERGHEGCDLMGDKMPGGYYPVVSMTGGIVEKVGWLEQGGYRIGVRAPKGAYFYYAHLDRYAKDWQEGDTVCAGELLGFMGDSGYGEERTTGMFPVHLHIGIYIKTDHFEELSVNPYWILRYLEKHRLTYDY